MDTDAIVQQRESALLGIVGDLNDAQISKIDQSLNGNRQDAENWNIVKRWLQKASESNSTRLKLIKSLKEESHHKNIADIVNKEVENYRRERKLAEKISLLESPLSNRGYQAIDSGKFYKDLNPRQKCPTTVVCILVGLCVFVVVIVAMMVGMTATFMAVAGSDATNLSTKSFPVLQNDTVFIRSVQPYWTSAVYISEIVEELTPHDCLVWAMEPNKLKYHTKELKDCSNSSTIYDETTVLREVYVYMLNESTLTYNICLSASDSTPKDVVMNIFDNEEAFKEYDYKHILDSPVYSRSLAVGRDDEMACTFVQFTAMSDNYYFAILKLPKNFKFHYTATARINYLKYEDYSNYSKCLVNDQKNCTITLGNDFLPDTTNYGIMAYCQPIRYLSTHYNHLQLHFNTRLGLIVIPGVTLLILLTVVSVAAISCICCQIRAHKQYVPLPIN